MGFFDGLVDFGKGAADIYSQVKTTDRVSKDGLARTGVRPETIADQASVGVKSPAGFNGANNGAALSVGGLQVSSPVLMATVLLVAGLAVVKVLK